MEEEKEKLNDAINEDSDEDEADDGVPIPPDGGWGWVIAFSSMVCNAIVDGLVFAFGVFLPEFVSYFDAPRSKVSLIGSLLAGVYLCLGPVVGGLVNKFGCRVVVMTGSLISSTAFILAMFSPTIEALIILYGAIGGIGFGMIYLPSIVIVGHYFEKKRALATGIAVCGSGVGTFIFAPLTKFLLDHYNWKNALLIVAGIVLNACVCGALMKPLELKKKTREPHTKTSKVSKTNGSIDMNGAKNDKIQGQVHVSMRLNGDQKEVTGLTILPECVHVREIQPLIRVGTSGVYHSQPNAITNRMTNLQVAANSHHNLSGSVKNISNRDYNRPLYKKDIFYSGSIVNISEYKSNPEITSYIASITSIPGSSGAPESRLLKICSCLPKPMLDAISEMLDISLFTDFKFICVCLGNFFALGGYIVPFVYIVDRALLAGIEKTEASFLLSIIGITATVGRFLAGALADLPFVNPLVLNNVCMVISSAVIFLTPAAQNYVSLVVIACIFGFSAAAFISLTTIILCDLLGLEKLTNAFGLLSLARGVAVVIGPPVAGAVFQSTGSYDASFYFGGSLFAAGTFLHCVLLLPGIWSKKKGTNDELGNAIDEEKEVELSQQ